MLYLEHKALHEIESANYVTSVNGMVHPGRRMETHDFLYILDGTWEVWEEETCYSMKTDDLLILTAGRHHFGKHPCNPGNRHMYIHIRPTEAERKIEAERRMETDDPELTGQKPEAVRPFQGGILCPSLLHCGKNERIREYFHEIIAEEWTQASGSRYRSSLLFSLLMCELFTFSESVQPGFSRDPLVEEICECVRTTPQTFFSAKEMAGQYYICERTLNNRFRKAVGKTFYAFQMETKLEMVKQFLLSQPEAKLREAALNYGFCDEFHLSKTFKKSYGISPSEFRKSREAAVV